MKNITYTNPLGLQGLLDTRGLNDFYTDLKSAFGKYLAAACTMGAFVDSKGDGLYTRTAARTGKALILNVIDGKKQIGGTNWPKLSPEQSKMHNVSAGYERHWKFRGNVYRNVVARKIGKGYEIGLKDKMVRSSGFLGGSSRKISVQKYAAWVEYGTSWMPARPLFSPVATYFATKGGPWIKIVVARAINRVAKKYKIEKTAAVTATDTRSVMSSYSEKASNPNEDFSGQKMQDVLNQAQMPGSGITKTDFRGKAGTNIKKINKETFTDLKRTAINIAGKHELLDGTAEDWLNANENWDKEFTD